MTSCREHTTEIVWPDTLEWARVCAATDAELCNDKCTDFRYQLEGVAVVELEVHKSVVFCFWG